MQHKRGFLEASLHGPQPGAPDVISGGNTHSFFSSPDTAKVQRFLDSYFSALEGWDPLRLEGQKKLPPELLEGLAKTGIFGLIIPTEYGGLGFSLSEYALVVEAMAKRDMALVLVPLAHLSIGLKAILLVGTEDQKKRYLEPAATGQCIFSYALTEPKHGSDAQHITTTAAKQSDGSWILNGGKTYITNANYSSAYTVFAQVEGEKPGTLVALIVESEYQGVKVGKDMDKMGLAISSTAPIQFKDVSVPKENTLGEPGQGFKIAMQVLNYGRLGLGGASAGLLFQSAQDMGERAKKRIQFDRPIIEFPLIREKIAKARANGMAIHAMTLATAAMLEDDPMAMVAAESSHCKLFGTDRCWDSLYDALQTAGGAGYFKTLPYEKRMRDFRVTTIFEGTSEIHSMYPSLLLARALGSLVKGKKGLAALGALNSWAGKRVLSKRLLPAVGPSGSGSQALEALEPAVIKGVKTLEAVLRRGAKSLVMTHGKKSAEREFELRRLTRLSMEAFALVSLWNLGSYQKIPGLMPPGYSEDDLVASLRYLLAEAQDLVADAKRPINGKEQVVEAWHLG